MKNGRNGGRTFSETELDVVEICAGGGGQALGLERAGFVHQVLVDNDVDCCNTLKFNRPGWLVECQNLTRFDGFKYRGVELLAGGLPCPPFSVAGQQLGAADPRDLFPTALRLVDEIRPRAVMIENVAGFLGSRFKDYRLEWRRSLRKLGYVVSWRCLYAPDFGVPQKRQRVVIVAMRKAVWEHFSWPRPKVYDDLTVADRLYDQMAANDWGGCPLWGEDACELAPTIVGGSKKHGGPDLGPTGAKRAWATMGIDGRGIADDAPAKKFVGMPRLTVPMVARLQGFPDDWRFTGSKTAAYRQVGNAFPPPMAYAVGRSLRRALLRAA